MVPPEKSRSSQLLPSEVIKTKKIAKIQMLVAQVIRSLKVLRFVTNEVLINMLSCIDDVLHYKYVQQFQIFKALFIGRNLVWY